MPRWCGCSALVSQKHEEPGADDVVPTAVDLVPVAPERLARAAGRQMDERHVWRTDVSGWKRSSHRGCRTALAGIAHRLPGSLARRRFRGSAQAVIQTRNVGARRRVSCPDNAANRTWRALRYRIVATRLSENECAHAAAIRVQCKRTDDSGGSTMYQTSTRAPRCPVLALCSAAVRAAET